MNQFANRAKITLTPALKAGLRNRFSRAALTVLGLFILAFSTALPARAGGCLGLDGRVNPVKFPLLENDGARGADTIVGLWQVTYTTSGDKLFGVSFKQWHSDGTEFENIDHSAVVGNICFGVWKEVGHRTVRLHHTGWTFDDNGNATGYFTNDETDTIARDGMSYSGTFLFKVFDANGNPILPAETTGTIEASRITVD